MSDTFDDTDPDDVNDDLTPAEDDRTPQALRRAANEGKKAKAELASAKRELAMLKAGVDTESYVGKLFIKGYDGDTTPEAIKAEWALATATVAPAPDPALPVTPDPEITSDESASSNMRAALANGAPADTPNPDPDPRTVASNQAKEIIAQGGSTDDALRSVFDTLVSAGMSGDHRVIIEG